MKKTLVLAVLSLFSATLAAQDGELAIAGRRASLEQAVAAPHARDYRLLVRRSELARVTSRGADAHVRGLLERARRGGAVLFVCEKDLRAERLQARDLLPGIVAVGAGDVWTNGSSPADERLRRYCS